MESGSWIELDESRLRSNLRFLRRAIGRNARMYSVVKGNAYGHGIDTFVPLAERNGVRHFAAYSASEAYDVRQALVRPDTQVMIMGQVDSGDLAWAIENDVSFYAFDLRRLDAALRVAQRLGRPARVHLEIETGMYRTGFSRRGLAAALGRVLRNPEHLVVVGACTHLAGAESSANYFRIQKQLETFHERLQQFEEAGVQPQTRHIACSAAVFTYPESILDAVRVGIAQYGYWPSEETRLSFLRNGMKQARRDRSRLKRILAWKSRIMSINTVPAGSFVGYGLSHQVLHRTRVASVPVGYTHGIPRAQSDGGRVLVHGRPCPLVGSVSMNMHTIDVTDVPEARPGDEVVLIGEQDRGEISVGSFGERTHVLNYEVLARLSMRIPRTVIARPISTAISNGS